MSNVDTKLKDFYDRGYNDAIDQCDLFLKAVETKFGSIVMENDLTFGKFIAIINAEINNFKSQRQPRESKNVE